jgi:hypothetical protein
MGAKPIRIQFEFQQIEHFCDMSSSDNGVLDSMNSGMAPTQQPQAGGGLLAPASGVNPTHIHLHGQL